MLQVPNKPANQLGKFYQVSKAQNNPLWLYALFAGPAVQRDFNPLEIVGGPGSLGDEAEGRLICIERRK